MESDDFDFLSNYQKSLFTDNRNTPNQRAGIQRKCLAQTYNYGLKNLEEQANCYLLENNLEKYHETVDEDPGPLARVQTILQEHNIHRPIHLESGLSSTDFKSFLKSEPCYKPNSFACLKSETITDADLSNLKKILHKPEPEISITKPKIVRVKSETENPFRSAREELPPPPRKRKFVVPLLTNNSEEEPQKTNNKEPDARLKNVDPKMVDLIKSEIMAMGATVEWSDIAGLEFAKTAVQEAVVWPMLRPDLFTGLRRPPKGILLFGPPGTGKTLIGKCVASQSKSTFFSISASSLTSKWVGDGEKMVRALFAVARCHQPAVIFIDEIDSLLSQRNETEHESSRRIKTEFLVQLDGATTDGDERLLLIGATNRPQELDEAARRRFVKRLYIPLPEFEARLQLLQKLVAKERHSLNDDDFGEIARLSDGYSGADIRNLCGEASLGPIRATGMHLIETIQANDVRPMLMDDFHKAFTRIKSSVSQKDLEQYVNWDKTYGSGL